MSCILWESLLPISAKKPKGKELHFSFSSHRLFILSKEYCQGKQTILDIEIRGNKLTPADETGTPVYISTAVC